MIRRPPRSTQSRSSAASDVYKRQVNVAVELGVLKAEDVLPLIDERPESVELVLTGRYAPPAFCERADLITEMKNVRHCYDAGVGMRKGIEYLSLIHISEPTRLG